MRKGRDQAEQGAKVFFRAGYANYDACGTGELRLVPDPAMLSGLRADFAQMLGSGMFDGHPPVFDQVMERLRQLEWQINTASEERRSP